MGTPLIRPSGTFSPSEGEKDEISGAFTINMALLRSQGSSPKEYNFRACPNYLRICAMASAMELTL